MLPVAPLGLTDTSLL